MGRSTRCSTTLRPLLATCTGRPQAAGQGELQGASRTLATHPTHPPAHLPSPPHPQAAYERLGKESMSLKEALSVMKQRSAEMAVKAQVRGRLGWAGLGC